MVQFEILYKELYPVLQMKKQDMKNQGIKNATEKEIWQYFVEKKWHEIEAEELRLHQMISDLFTISTDQYKAFQQLKKLEKKEHLAEIDEAEIEKLLGDL